MKRVPIISPAEAASMVKDGDTMMVGGFGMTGNPVHLLHALAESPVKNLTYIANNVGEPGLGGGRLLRNGQIKKAIGSFFTSNPEAVRAGGAGIGGFYTPTAVGTNITAGDDTKMIDGQLQVFVHALHANVAFI